MGLRFSQPVFFAALSVLALGATPAQPRNVKPVPVRADILGVGIGTSLERARALLDPLGEGMRRTTRSGGQKAAWTLDETDYSSVALKTDRRGRVVWISGFLRSDRQPAFADLGDTGRADRISDVQAIWNVTPKRGEPYRLVAKGDDGRASVIYLLGQ